MKNLIRIANVLLLFCCTFATAQTPQLMSYQAVVRNESGVLVANANVSLRISILQNTTDGTAVYIETHTASTNENGLVTLKIGGGNIESGNFSTINWGSGTYFIKTETDPDGGSNYSISGTNQLLSVPYALYSANTKPQGKPTIYLTGAVTDSEAAEIIASDAGPNTENIYIVGTKVLTIVDIPGVNSLINLQVKDNWALQSLSLNSVKAIYADIAVANQNPDFNLSLPNCTHISATTNITITGALNMPALKSIYNTALYISANALNLPALESVTCNGSQATFNASTAINLPVITTFQGDNPQFGWVNDTKFLFSAPQISMGIVNAAPNNLTISGIIINLPALTYANRVRFSNTAMTQLTLPNLISASLGIDGCTALTSVSLPSFTTFLSSSDQGSGINGSYIKNNVALTTLSLPSLSNIDTAVVAFPLLQLSGNAFSSSSINNILHQLLTVTPVYKVDLTSQHPSAAPTGQGIIDKQTLISQGKQILTD